MCLCRLARRVLWRKRKLWVHARENKAAISIQCAIRVYLARKNMQRQVHHLLLLLLGACVTPLRRRELIRVLHKACDNPERYHDMTPLNWSCGSARSRAT